MIFIEVVFDVSADHRDAVIELAGRTAAATRTEHGCVRYRFSIDVEVPNRFVLTELWETEQDLNAHFGGEPYQNFFAELPAGGSLVGKTAWQGPLAPYTAPNPEARPPT
jgi:quinol monooxygenase YgiN